MLIALDFDDTYTNDEVAWVKFVQLFRDYNHDVVIVTRRHDDGDNLDIECSMLVHLYKLQVIYTGHQPKREFCEKLGINIDVWIDDSPEFIVS